MYEGLPKFKIVGKIDLEASKRSDRLDKEKREKREKKKNSVHHESVTNRATIEYEKNIKNNLEYIKLRLISAGAPDKFLDENGAISSILFRKSNGGYIPDDDVDNEENAVEERNEKAFKKNEAKDGFLAEKVIPIIFNKLFRNSDFVIVDANPHDDHENGVDQVIINIKTGETICALDDFVSNDELIKERPEIEEYYNNKIDRFVGEKVNGARLKYGAIFENGSFQRLSKLENLPLAVLRVERDLFYKAMRDMDFSIESDLCDTELELSRYIISSLEKQLPNLSENMNVSYDSVFQLVEFLKQKIT